MPVMLKGVRSEERIIYQYHIIVGSIMAGKLILEVILQIYHPQFKAIHLDFNPSNVLCETTAVNIVSL